LNITSGNGQTHSIRLTIFKQLVDKGKKSMYRMNYRQEENRLQEKYLGIDCGKAQFEGNTNQGIRNRRARAVSQSYSNSKLFPPAC